MDDTVPKENPPPDFNKIDLSQLQGFSFGTQWTQDKGGSQGNRGDQRPRQGGADVPSDRRDRRAFRRPEGAPPDGGPENRAPSQPAGAPRKEFSGDRRPRHDARDFRGTGARPGPDRMGHPGGARPGAHEQRAPYDSPYFSVTFYPEDTSFNALVKTVRASCRTIELFEIARTVLGKPERFTVLLTRKDPSAPRASVPGRQPAPPAPSEDASAEGAAAPAAAAGAPSGPPKEPIFIAVPDGLPFETEEAAVSHVLSKHLPSFFDLADVEVEPPKGNFQVINRCGVTGELLGPPNYHRYNQIVQQHFASKGLRMPFDAFRSRIETVRDPEVVAQWLEKMKKVTRYTSKVPPAEGQAAASFDAWEDARSYLLTQAKDKIVRPAGHGRFHGREVESLPQGEIRRAIEGTLERQRRFPLDTANALRGRLRREHFTIFKKGAKGISYVCAVKRKFRTPGQTFAETIGGLINFIEGHPMVKAGELPNRFLGLSPDSSPPGDDAAAALANVLSVEQREKIARLQGDLLWLVREGYVTEFIDGALYAPPPMVESRKKEVERDDHDPENFPDRPPEAPAAGQANEPAGQANEPAGQASEGPAAEESPAPEPSPGEPSPGANESPSEPPPAAPAHQILSSEEIVVPPPEKEEP